MLTEIEVLALVDVEEVLIELLVELVDREVLVL